MNFEVSDFLLVVMMENDLKDDRRWGFIHLKSHAMPLPNSFLDSVRSNLHHLVRSIYLRGLSKIPFLPLLWREWFKF